MNSESTISEESKQDSKKWDEMEEQLNFIFETPRQYQRRNEMKPETNSESSNQTILPSLDFLDSKPKNITKNTKCLKRLEEPKKSAFKPYCINSLKRSQRKFSLIKDFSTYFIVSMTLFSSLQETGNMYSSETNLKVCSFAKTPVIIYSDCPQYSSETEKER